MRDMRSSMRVVGEGLGACGMDAPQAMDPCAERADCCRWLWVWHSIPSFPFFLLGLLSRHVEVPRLGIE